MNNNIANLFPTHFQTIQHLCFAIANLIDSRMTCIINDQVFDTSDQSNRKFIWSS